MDQLNSSFWLGLAAGIPLSILANLLTPRAQQWLARRSSSKAANRVSILKAEIENLERLVSEPGRLQTYLLESVLGITLLISMFAVLAGTAFAIGSLFPGFARLLPLGQLLVVCGAIVVSKECIEALRKSSRARNIEEYRAKVKSQLSELDTSA